MRTDQVSSLRLIKVCPVDNAKFSRCVCKHTRSIQYWSLKQQKSSFYGRLGNQEIPTLFEDFEVTKES